MPTTTARPARALAVVAILVATLGACAPSVSPTPSGSAEPSGPAVAGDLRVDPAACPFEGPAAAVGGMVLAESSGAGPDPDTKGGRVRICLAAPLAEVELEMDAECRWLADRSSPRTLSTRGALAMGERLSALLHLAPPGVSVSRSDLAGDARGTYGPPRDGSARFGSIVDRGGRSGVAAFEGIELRPEGDRPAVPLGGAGGPTTISGVIRWACEAPPEPVAGVSVGRVGLRVDGVPGEAAAPAECRWATVGGAAMVTSVETSADAMAWPGGDVGLSIHRTAFDPEANLGISVSVSQTIPPFDSSHYSVGRVDRLDIALDFSTGAVRYRRIGDGEAIAVTIDGTAATRLIAGLATWSCAQPPAKPVADPGGGPPGELRSTRAGRASLVLDAPAVRVDFPVTCGLGPVEDDPQQVQTLAGTFDLGAEIIRFRASDGIALLRLDASGTFLGEYELEQFFIGQEADRGPYTQAIRNIEFVPTDPRYVPIGGPGGPRTLSATLTWDCRDPNAPPRLKPDESLGELTWSLADGRSWTVRAACSWTTDQAAVVHRVDTLAADIVTVGRHELRFVASPDPQLIVTTTNGTALYRSVGGTAIEDVELGAAGSSGLTTFRGLGVGRLEQGHLKLDGIHGPDAIDGSVSWRCGPQR